MKLSCAPRLACLSPFGHRSAKPYVIDLRRHIGWPEHRQACAASINGSFYVRTAYLCGIRWFYRVAVCGNISRKHGWGTISQGTLSRVLKKILLRLSGLVPRGYSCFCGV